MKTVGRHSLLLALEPRQVFDGAVGAAIEVALAAEVQPVEAEQPSEAQEAAQAAQAEQEAAQRESRGAPMLLGGFGPYSGGAPGLSIEQWADENENAPNKIPSIIDANASTTIRGISVADLEGDTLTVTIHAQTKDGGDPIGSFDCNNLGGVTITKSPGQAGITLVGSASDINWVLNTLNYQSQNTGWIELVVEVDDGSSRVSHTVDIKVNDRPSIDSNLFPGSLEENTPSAPLANNELSFGTIKVFDPNCTDGSGDKLHMELKLEDPANPGQLLPLGELKCTAAGQGTVWEYGADKQSISLLDKASAQDIQNILNNLTYKG